MTSQRILAVFVLAATALATPTGDALGQLSAQVEQLDAYKAVVTGDKALVRCGPGAAYYPVSEILRPGTILTVDGQTSAGWLRVSYPATAAALVRADHVDLQSDGQTAVLNREDALAAFNASTGARGSWDKLLKDEPLPAGTRLQIIGEAMNELTGELAGYQVEAPAAARGYIRTGSLRRATSADLEAAANASGESVENAAAPATTTPAAVSRPVSPAQDNAAGSVNDTLAQNAEQNTEQNAEQGTDAIATDDADTSAEQTPVQSPATQNEAAPGEAAAEPPAPRVIQSLDDLEAAFAAVQNQPIAEAEFDQLLSEVDRMIAATPADPANQGLLDALNSRRTVLSLRKRIQVVYRENQAAANQASVAAMSTEKAVAKIKQDLGFTAVGRLLPSAVYDGNRLPRMYRIQALDTTEAPRTLGYLRPDPAFAFESKLNQTVGVVGALRNDPRLNLQVIEPIRVDVIQVNEGE